MFVECYGSMIGVDFIMKILVVDLKKVKVSVVLYKIMIVVVEVWVILKL